MHPVQITSIGSIYEINDFNVVEVNDDYLTVHKDIQIHFHACTYIVESTDQGLRIPQYKFSFISYEEIAKRINDKKYLTDIFGMLKHVGDVQDVYKRNGDTTIKRELWVELSCGNKIAITLWGDKTELVEPHQVKPNSTTVIFSSGLVKEFDRKPTLSATSATKLYLDMDIEETRRLMKSNSKRKYDAEDEEFFTSQKYDVTVHQTTLPELLMEDGLKKNEGKKNSFGVTKSGIDHWCKKCNTSTDNPIYRYKLEVEVEDKNTAALIVIFDKEVEFMIKSNVTSMLQLEKSENGFDEADKIFQQLVGREYVFHVRASNFQSERGFKRLTANKVFYKVKEEVDDSKKSNNKQGNGTQDKEGSGFKSKRGKKTRASASILINLIHTMQ